MELWHVFGELTSEPGPIPASEWMRVIERRRHGSRETTLAADGAEKSAWIDRVR